jgi:TRAP transporter TAXI family solute receptor
MIAVTLISCAAVAGSALLLVQNQQQVVVLTLATGSKSGEYFAFGQALANVTHQHYPHIRIEVRETNGSVQNIELMESGSAHLALVQSDTPVRSPVRAVSFLFSEMFHLIASTESGIQQVPDLQGRRIALMPKGSGSYSLFWPLVQHYDLDETSFTALPMPVEQAYQALAQGDVDALFRVTALGNEAIRDLLQSQQAGIVPIDQVDALRLTLPYLEGMTIPKGTYGGNPAIPERDLPVVGVRALLVAHVDVEPSVIQVITQTLYEFRNEITEQYPRAATIVMPTSSENFGLPLHPGAKAFFQQDQPSFLERYSDSLGFILSVTVLTISGIWQFRLWWQERQKNRADMYNLQILELVTQIQESTDLAQISKLRQQLFEILRRVVADLDQDRITAQSFQSFTLPWEVAFSTLRHREAILLDLKSKHH